MKPCLKKINKIIKYIPSIVGHLGWLCILVLMNPVAVTMAVLLRHADSEPFGIHQEGVADSYESPLATVARMTYITSSRG